jgi:hypothetical protein
MSLYIFMDKGCMEFSPLRHLLVYLSVTGIKIGYWFPFYVEGVMAGTHNKQMWSYQNYNSRLNCFV